MTWRVALTILAIGLVGCQPAPAVSRPSPTPQPTPIVVTEAAKPLISLPPATRLTPAGDALIIEFEVGGRQGYRPRPEAPDARASGITEGIGYDNHQYSPVVIVSDWAVLGPSRANRLAATHPYFGRTAQAHLHEVADILIPFVTAYETFTNVDVSREFAAARRAYGREPFDALRPNCQAALISVGFNRGYSFAGPNRSEMRVILSLVPRRDYDGMASQLEHSSRVWRGTEIEHGMTRRRYAEAKLIRTP
jgi:GH24 family phage-related lysozyme (muramidase)